MKNVADIYPLTPVQQGMLFHTLANPRTGVYINQFTCQLQGTVQPQQLHHACQQAVAHHSALRAAFLWEGLDEPLQVIRAQVTLPWQYLDWRTDWQTLETSEQVAQLDEFLKCDRNQAFDLAQAPLLRVTLIRLDTDLYQLIWTNHHILFDGWSLLLVWQDVLLYYGAQVKEHLPEIASVRPFRDYIAFQQRQDHHSAATFWKQQLKGFTTPTSLPTAETVSHRSDRGYQQASINLSTELTTHLKTLARTQRLTLNTLIQSAWALLLNHYSGQGQVTYGTVVSGRPAALTGVETMVGLFINTLPVCVRVEPNQSLSDWLQVKQQQLLALRQYETTPLAEIQRWSEMPAGTALFESIVAFENLTAAPAPELDFQISNEQYLEQSNYPLALLVFPNEGLDLRLLYDVDRFEAGAIQNVLNHLEYILTTFVEHPQARLADLPRLTPAEEKQLSIWQSVDYPRHRCIHQLIEDQVQRMPEATAVVFNQQSLTYGDLNQQANQLAHWLRSQGVSPGDRIAIGLHRSLEMVVAILAVLKAGAAYIPLDPTYPTARLAYCLQDTAPQWLLTQRSVLSWETSVPCLYLDDDNPALTTAAITNPENLADPADLAYIIYTSGSTGTPKGVMVSHQNLMHSTTARFQVYDKPVGRFLLLSSIAFDSSIAGLFWPLCQGGTLVIAPDRIEQDLQQLATLIATQQVTHTLCVPTLYNLLLKAANPAQLSSLQTVIVAGEACPRTLAQQHYEICSNADLYNEYGPTEATVWCTAYRVPCQLAAGAISIGSAIPNTYIRLLDKRQQPVPIGAVGELYIGGEGITQGYLNQPDKTAEAFVTVDAPLYRTGDLARYRADGNLVWLGRSDRQVKVRGYRIELGEIEDQLRAQSTVQDAVVVATATSESTSQPTVESLTVERLVSALERLPDAQAQALLASVEGGY